MVVGDVVSGISPAGVAFNFQPAAGIECILTSLANYGHWVALYDGALVSWLYVPAAGYNPPSKLMVNNTNYFHAIATSIQPTSYSGIQIK